MLKNRSCNPILKNMLCPEPKFTAKYKVEYIVYHNFRKKET